MAAGQGKLREVNLELGMPIVDQAMKRLTLEMQRSRSQGFAVLKIIHGYGSSGTGGKIRTASRKYLKEQKEKGTIRDYIPGEKFTIFEEATRRAFAVCPPLKKDRDLEQFNNGVTFIVL